MKTRIPVGSLALLAVLVALGATLLPHTAQAATIAYGFAGQGVYPVTATANSQRWFRVTVTWDIGKTNAGDEVNPIWMANEIVTAVAMDLGVGFNPGYGGNLWTIATGPNPKFKGVAPYSPADGTMTITLGPFSGYHSDWLVGSADGGPFQFSVVSQKWDNTAKVYVTQPPVITAGSYTSVPLALPAYAGSINDSAEQQAWYSGAGVGVDPLTVTAGTTPDQGSSSSTYTFRTKYYSWVDGQVPVWRVTPDRTMPAEGAFWCNFDGYAASALAGTVNDNNKVISSDSAYPRQWLYSSSYSGLATDYHLDHIGYDRSVLNPEALLILDRQYNRPFYMNRESGDFATGVVYRYDLMPTNYLQLMHNALLFPFDPAGEDTWDLAAMAAVLNGVVTGIAGRPASNGYTALMPGGHKYEFLTCRDWDPPVWRITDRATGSTMIGKCSLALSGRPGGDATTGALTAMHIITGGAGTEDVYRWFSDLGGGGYGYPYNSQSGQYPKSDPVLTAHPYFPSGFNSPGAIEGALGPGIPGAAPNPFNPLANNGEPWGPVVGPTATGVSGGFGGAQVSSLRFTNEDTISPNLVDIWDDTVAYNPDLSQPSAYRGGKWTTDSNFVFRINYWQSDNIAPQATQVFIRKTDASGAPTTGWLGSSMQKVYPSDTNYTDGCVYYYQAAAVSLPGGGGAGDYQYYFSFSDGTHTAIYPTRPSDDFGYLGVPPGANNYYWFRVNHKPVLDNQSLTPGSGTQGQDFVFKVRYTDKDGTVRTGNPQGDRPFKALIWIDLFGDVQGQMQVKSLAGTTMTYDFLAPVPDGGGIPYPAGTFNPAGKPAMKVHFQTGAAAGQELVITGNTVGTGQGTITISGALPVGVTAGDKFQVVDWFGATMDPVNPGDTNYFDAAGFLFDTARAGVKLDPGVHNYSFEFWDNWAYWINWEQYFMTPGSTPPDLKVEGEMTRLPASPNGYYEGPLVLGNRAPQLSKVYFAPPAADTATKAVDATHLNYIRPLGRLPYANGSLTGKFLEFQTGQAALRVYQIDGNTTTQVVVHKVSGSGDLVADRVVLGDTFRVFDAYSVDQGLGGAYHADPSITFDGTPATGFRIFATYSDADNSAPTSIRVALYSSETQPANSPDAIFDMGKVTAGDSNFVAGVEYRTTRTVSLSPGQHWIRVQANDGSTWASGGTSADDWFGAAVSPTEAVDGPVVIVNHPPNPPDTGFSPAGREAVNVAKPTLRWNPATDPDPGDRVVRYTIQLSKTGFAGDAYDFQYVSTTNQVAVTRALADLTMWSWRVKSEDTLGATSVWSEVQEFFVDLSKAPGVLAPPGGDPTQTLTPLVGDLSTVFRYQIVYSNADGIAPVSGVYVEIDGELYATQLTKLDPTATDYVAGVTYYVDIRGDSSALGYGAHDYRFYAGAVSWPAGAVAAAVGPWVDSAARLSINNSSWTPIVRAEEGSKLYLQLTDADKAGQPSVQVTATVAGGGDSESVTLNSFNATQGVFRGTLRTVGAAGAPGDGVLNVQPGPTGTTVTVTYSDPTMVGSPSPDNTSAEVLIVDSTAPKPVRPFLTVQSGTQGVSILLDWSTYLAPDDVAGYHVWLSNSAFVSVASMTPVATVGPTVTSYEIKGLQAQTIYHVAVTAFDEIPNEITDVQSKSIKTLDRTGPDAVDQSPVRDATGVPLSTTISFRLTDPVGVKTGSIQVWVGDDEVTRQITKVPATGTPASVQITYVGSFTWNQVVTVRVVSRDRLGNQSDRNWQFSTIVDRDPPRVTDLSPTAGATGVSPGAPISFHVRDDVSGVDVGVASLKLYVNGVPVPRADLQINSANLNDVIVNYVRPGGLPAGARATLRVSAADRAGNLMPDFTWSFTTLYAISGRVTTADGAGKPGVEVTNGVVSATTGPDGRYALLGVANGTYTVVPSLEFFTFDPLNWPRVVVSGASKTGIDFTAIPQTYSISGTISNSSGNPVEGVQVSEGIFTNAQGRYVISGLLPGTITVTPTSSAWTFSPVSRQVTVPTTDFVDFVAHQAFRTTFSAGTSMVGVPFDPLDRTATTVFGTNSVRRWNPLASPPGYVQPSDPGSATVLDVRAGKGYFVSYRAPFSMVGSGNPVSTSVPYAMSLGPVWNMIANPFPMNLPVANLRPALSGGTDPYVFIYDNASGSYRFVTAIPGVNVARTYLEPWEGAWIRSLVGTTSVSATAPVGASAATAAKPQSLAVGQGGYIIPVVARAAGRADLCSAAGVRAEGAYEIANPPALSGSVDLYFVDEAGKTLAQQLKPAAATAQSWEFVVATDLAKAEVSVSLPDLSQVPSDLSVLLVDEDGGRTVYMRTTPQYTFRSGAEGAVRHFRLEVAPRGADNLVISAAAAQQSGRGVVVTYSVSAPCQVSVEVLNVAGRVVRRLTADTVVAAGINSQSWNLRAESGSAVPSGTYLVRVQAVTDRGQRVQAVTQVNVVR